LRGCGTSAAGRWWALELPIAVVLPGGGDYTGTLTPCSGVYGTPQAIQTWPHGTVDVGGGGLDGVHVGYGWIYPGPEVYNEQEDNDAMAQANPFPAFPFTGWRGSIGYADGYIGYDGDFDDWYSFSAAPGDDVVFRAYCYNFASDVLQSLPCVVVDANGNALSNEQGSQLGEFICHVGPADVAPFYLHANDGNGDYWIDGSISTP